MSARTIVETWVQRVKQLREVQNKLPRGSENWLLYKVEADRLEQCAAELWTYLDVYETVRQS